MSLPHGKGKLGEKTIEVAAPATRTTTFTSAAIDLTNVHGLVKFVLHSTNGSGNADNTLTPKFQSSLTTGGTYADVTYQPTWIKGSDQPSSPTAFPAILGTGTNPGPIVCFLDPRDLAGKNFVKFIATPAGTSPSNIYSVTYEATDEYPTTGL